MYGTESTSESTNHYIRDLSNFKKTFPEIPESEHSQFHSKIKVFPSANILINFEFYPFDLPKYFTLCTQCLTNSNYHLVVIENILSEKLNQVLLRI